MIVDAPPYCGHPRDHTRWRPQRRQLARLLPGLVLFAAGDAFIIAAHLGNAPWTVLAQGVALHTPLTVGTATQVIGLAVLVGWLPLRERPGIGTLLNVVVIGATIDVMLHLLPTPSAVMHRWAFLLAGVALIGVGSGLYLGAQLGAGPRDGLMTGLAARFGWPVGPVRAGIEVAVLAGGWALGGTVGVGTVAFALLIGPAVAWAVGALGQPASPVGVPRA